MAFDGEAFVDRFNTVWHGHDIEGILAMMTDDVIFEASFGKDPRGCRRAPGAQRAGPALSWCSRPAATLPRVGRALLRACAPAASGASGGRAELRVASAAWLGAWCRARAAIPALLFLPRREFTSS